MGSKQHTLWGRNESSIPSYFTSNGYKKEESAGAKKEESAGESLLVHKETVCWCTKKFK